ncbi:PQQ-dependent sugar dehydrogenase [Reyranella sp.]|jgi:glucose/arabinose dehydrogenase|uniref:PQQ-dependent sugar dehydrogenase n=1 Tax=Reyranella sp. TaxID=1929291 RepID=UPI0027237B53|nr:PQQ-dependent sugar dehydrogenase [Reyranella sp.]MDO8972857.1 PQQ-dependent sugar dehydrogenase [Reyranella sp.]
MLRKVFLGRRRLLTASAAAAVAAPAIVRAQQVLRSSKGSYSLRMLTLDLEQPWGMAFLPDGRLLITERPGRLRIFANGRLERAPVGGLPKVYARGQGGLLDVCLHPDFARNARLYLTYSGEGEGGAATVLARAEFRNNALVGVQRIFEALPRTSGGLHFGSRVVFDRAGLLYVTCGERYQMQRAQNLADLGGKVVRLRDDGTVPPDNPFVGREGARPEIFTYGHRNPQGMAMHPVTGRIWLVEHGPRGGDELNLLKAGANYGWPRATHGIDYSGSTISPSKSLPGMEDPVRVWVPSISPSGLAFYTGDRFPGWKGSVFTGALSDNALIRIELDGDRYVGEERLLVDLLPYIRDVRQGPDGLLYIVTHTDSGGLYRLEPA